MAGNARRPGPRSAGALPNVVAPERGGRDAEEALHDARHVALVEEARAHGHVGQRNRRRREQLAGATDAETPYEVPDRAAEVVAEGAGDVDTVDASQTRQRSQVGDEGEIARQKFLQATQPEWRPPVGATALPARALRQYFECDALDDEPGHGVRRVAAHFQVRARGQLDHAFVLHDCRLDWCGHDIIVAAEARQRLDDETATADVAVAAPVGVPGWGHADVRRDAPDARPVATFL